ncbi:Folate-dependent protein for Fe/S cluster synthesis/repair in oxidative stress [Brevundimonas diminuta 3F5N]|uniref:Folate-dependent protein for Fe/S cluster synthesis/repair in oxidative stress n=1 Tax=Brevundimonas diminuta 3F5N TaxID=1255603 RepID=A0A1R4GAS0_BREDI|nr:folate-binding protein YgfZ [Brevundimonas diminuta]SJM65102.1 Folate-dependent protein for Fe/S cluster synthesis/repair in oxidative stress [Brevundimonas diminuta 3F5N]
MSIARLDSRALIRVSGPDARPFLHNLLTQDVETLQPGELRFGALLSPPGRLLFDLFIWGEEDGVVLDVAAERRDALVQRLSMYKLRSRVEVMSIPDAVFVAWGASMSDGFVGDPRLPDLGGRRWGDQSAADATEADWQARRLSLGVPDPTQDALMDKTYPIEADFDLLNGIDFHKGCFIGQETTSRMKRRGTIKNRMMAIAFDGPAPERGAEVLNGELRAGEVMTGAEGRAIALMRLDRMDGDLTVEGRPVRVEKPAWIPDL